MREKESERGRDREIEREIRDTHTNSQVDRHTVKQTYKQRETYVFPPH